MFRRPIALLACAFAFLTSWHATYAQEVSTSGVRTGIPIGESASVVILRNGFVFDAPTFPYQGNHFYYDYTPGDNDLPWLRSYAAYKQIFAGIDMSLEWKEREWDMIKAIINHTAQTLRFSGANTDPSLTNRAKLILTGAMEHPEYLWGCGEISQAAVGLAQAFGIPARMVNGRDLVNECFGDYCCEMYSTRYNRWIFVMPHVNAWIEHAALGPLGVVQLRQYDLAGFIQSTYVAEHTTPYILNGVPQFDLNGDPILITIPGHYEAIPHPPLIFMPSRVNLAPMSPYMSVNWWSGMFHHFAVSYLTTLQQEYPSMLELFNDDELNQTTCSPYPPIPVIDIEDRNITYPLNNVQASAQILGDYVLIQLKNNMIDFVEYQINLDDGGWHPIDLPTDPTSGTYLWIPGSIRQMAIRGFTQAGVTSPDVLLRYRPPTGN